MKPSKTQLLKAKAHRLSDRLLEAAIRYFDYYPKRKTPAIALTGFLLGVLFALVLFPAPWYVFKLLYLLPGYNALLLLGLVCVFFGYVLKMK